MGPVLFFQDIANGHYHLAALIAVPTGETPPQLVIESDTASSQMAPPEPLGGRLGKTLWRYRFVLPEGHGQVAYTLGHRTWRVHPPMGKALRIAYVACNGVEDDDAFKDDSCRNHNWQTLAREHARAPFNLLLHGGDQLYADHLWQAVPLLAHWRELPRRQRLTTPWTAQMAKAVADFYFARYLWLWSQPALAPLLASIPSLMMWDDHDLFDGWGSHETALQHCPVFQGIGAVARDNFIRFQRAAHPDECSDNAHLGWAVTVGSLGIIAPDLRSERTPTQVMGPVGWDWLCRALERLHACQQVLLLSSTPVVNADLSLVERIAQFIPGTSAYRNDLRDQWQSYAHNREWQRLITYLLDFADQSGARLTILSGEIHLGALGLTTRGTTNIYQLTSSGIVHPPPARPLVHLLEVFSHNLRAPNGVAVKMRPLPGGESPYLASRNWLAIDFYPQAPLHVAWHVEDSPAPLTLDLG